jgi:hypothetical protein
MQTTNFFAYYSTIPKDPTRPFQVCTKIGCLLASHATQERANQTVQALQADLDNGTLPINLREWDKHDQYLKD